MNLQQNIPLAPFTTLGVGGNARWFATAATEQDVADAVRFSHEEQLPLFVLGGGSNLLVSDSGFPGLVLHMALQGIEGLPASSGSVVLRAAAGESWDSLVQFAVDRNLAGMECLAGIPGTTGGTPVQNVGAYGQEVAETIHSVRCFDTETCGFVELSNADCGFAYRTSLLNTAQRGRYVITRVDFALAPGGAPRLDYADLRKHFAGSTPSLREVAEAVRAIRRGKGMVVDPADPNSRSAGSFFRNPVVKQELLSHLSAATGVSPDAIPNWPTGGGECTKLPAAWLLERAGFVRGYSLGAAGISERHTLALINRGGATAGDVTALRDRIIATVQERFGIRLEQEPVSVGEGASST
ncbi:MAG: UDP-N-acetylmuramate dehydrogenase [Janthinobacterium lividum]